VNPRSSADRKPGTREGTQISEACRGGRPGDLAGRHCGVAFDGDCLARRHAAECSAHRDGSRHDDPGVRVAVVATRLSGASPPTAEVRVELARRVGSSSQEFDEQRLREGYFWNTVSRPQALCRLEITTVGTRHTPGSRVSVQLLLSPSVGYGRMYRFALPTR
jgi:hypothetical protein